MRNRLLQRMASPLVGIRMQPELLDRARRISEEEGFQSLQEFVRESVRARVEAFERQQAIEVLKKLAGSAKRYTPRTKEELSRLAGRLYGI